MRKKQLLLQFTNISGKIVIIDFTCEDAIFDIGIMSVRESAGKIVIKAGLARVINYERHRINVKVKLPPCKRGASLHQIQFHRKRVTLYNKSGFIKKITTPFVSPIFPINRKI